MFFTKHTTPYEQRQGHIPCEVLLNRYLAAKKLSTGPSCISSGEVHASIAVGDKLYELGVELSNLDAADTGLYWEVYEIVERVAQAGEVRFLPENARIPLDMVHLVESLCETFKLDPNLVASSAVDVLAYSADNEEEAFLTVPRPEDQSLYLLSHLHASILEKLRSAS